jgi:hypothetical protein
MIRKASLTGVLPHVPLFSSCNAKELKSIARNIMKGIARRLRAADAQIFGAAVETGPG